MDKEELMRMAHDAGFDVGLGMPLDDKVRPVFKIAQDEMQAFASAVLERAALECEKIEDRAAGDYIALGLSVDRGARQGAESCAKSIRALKPSNDA